MSHRLSLVSTRVWPPGGWSVTVPETRIAVRATSFEGLVNAVRDNLISNGHQPPAGLPALVAHWVCEQKNLSGEWCREAGEPPTRAVTTSDVVSFFKFLKAWATDARFVPQEEAERRAAICSTCPNNVPISGWCAGCASLAAKLVDLIGSRTTSKDSEIHGCAVCGCSLKAAVHFPLEPQWKGVPESAVFPDFCWKKPPDA